MLEDLQDAPAIYRPGEYWRTYHDRTVRWLFHNPLDRFRFYDVPLRAFGGGAEGVSPKELAALRSAYQENPLLKAWDRLCRWAANRFPRLRQPAKLLTPSFHLTNIQYRGRHQRKALRSELERLIASNPEILKVADTRLGQPSGIVNVRGNLYSRTIYNKIREYLRARNRIDFEGIDSILEIGPGYGAQFDVILQMHPDMRACIVDIPPQLYICQEYLAARFPGRVDRYHEAKREGIVPTLENRQIVCLAPWQIEDLPSDAFDLLLNMASFQEMAPRVVGNYADHVHRTVDRYLYIANNVDGDTGRPDEERTETSYEEIEAAFDEFELSWADDTDGFRRGVFVRRGEKA